MNPLIPDPLDVVLGALVLGAAALWVAAFVSMIRARSLGPGAFLGWLAATVLLPVVGPGLWFAFGRRAVRGRGVRAADSPV